MGSLLSSLRRVHKSLNPPKIPRSTTSKPIKFGILGAAAIAPIALVFPAKSHPEVIVYAVAARDKSRAEEFAKKQGIEKVYGGRDGYQELLNDPEVDAVYNPLPNGLHYEWTMKALLAGKHVLLEKPSADTAEETRQMYDLAEKKGLVLLEAFHYRFHPAIQRVKAIIDSGELGIIKDVEAQLAVPSGYMKENDIRYDYSLGGGALMDMGCYTLNCIRYLTSSTPLEVLSASQIGHISKSKDPAIIKAALNVDRRTTAAISLRLNNPSLQSPEAVIEGKLTCDLGMPPRFGFIPRWPQVRARVTCEKGSVNIYNFVAPTFYHHITVDVTSPDGKRRKRVEKVYTFADQKLGEAWWTTYRFQLEAFIDKLKGRTPQTWLDRDDAVENMKCIEKIYEKTGLGSRPKSSYVYTDSAKADQQAPL